MGSKRSMNKEYRKLAKLKLAPHTRADIWQTIEQRIDAASTGSLTTESTDPFEGSSARRWRTRFGPIAAAVAAIVALAVGIPVVMHQLRLGTPSTGSSQHVKSAANSVGKPGNVDTTTNQSRSSNPLFLTKLTLPTGQVVTPLHPVKWKNLDISLQIPSLPPPQAGPQDYLAIIGNHSSVLSHSTVQTSAGPATLVLNDRTPPAAANSTTPTYEYWVIVYGSQYTYAIDATVIGDRKAAKSEVMSLLHNWTVPGMTASSNQPITVADIRHDYVTQKQRVVHVTPVPKYHAVIVESNVNPTVANDFTWWDLRTGQHYRLAGRPLYMKLDHVISADQVVLFATGADNIGPGVSFPFYVVAKRPNAMSPFTTQRQTAYLPVRRSVSLGNLQQEMLTKVVTSTDGVEMVFGPNPGEPAGNFSTDYGAPPTSISYSASQHDVVIRFKNTNAQISPTALQSVHNAFVSISSLQTQGPDTILTLHLAAQAKYYTGKVVHTNPPSLTLTFAAQQP